MIPEIYPGLSLERLGFFRAPHGNKARYSLALKISPMPDPFITSHQTPLMIDFILSDQLITKDERTAPATGGTMSDDMRTMIVSSITALTEEANSTATKIGAATTDKTKLVHDILTDENATDETVKKFQGWKEALLAKLDEEEAKAREYAATLIQSGEEIDVDAAKATYKELADKVKTARKFYLTTLPGATEEDLKDVPALKTLRGGTASNGGGGKRPRVQRLAYRANTTENWTEVSKQSKNAKDEDVTVTNFTVLAGALAKAYSHKVEVKELQAAAFEAAGTDDLNSLEGKVFEFAITVGEGDKSQTVFVQVQPKSDSDE